MVKIVQYYRNSQVSNNGIGLVLDVPTVFKVSKSKVSHINFYFLHSKFGLMRDSFSSSWMRKKSDRYFFQRWRKIFPKLIGLRVGIYIGNKFHSFRIRPQIVGSYLGSFVRTYKIPLNTRFKKKNVYRSKKNVLKGSVKPVRSGTMAVKKVNKRK